MVDVEEWRMEIRDGDEVPVLLEEAEEEVDVWIVFVFQFVFELWDLEECSSVAASSTQRLQFVEDVIFKFELRKG